jgi:hypothetical protein
VYWFLPEETSPMGEMCDCAAVDSVNALGCKHPIWVRNREATTVCL